MHEDWQTRLLGSFIEFKNGLNADKNDYGSGLKFVNVMDIFTSSGLYEENIIGSVQTTEKAAREYSVEFGDILFNRTSETPEDIAYTAVYLDEHPITFGGFVIRGRQTDKILDPEFCKHAFCTDAIRKEFIRRGQGAVRANIGQQDLAKVPIRVPPLPEQRRIAEILLTWDEAIEKLEALRAAKEARLKTLTFSMVFGTNQFREFQGGGEPTEYRWFDLPQDWRCNSIGSISEEVSIRNGDDEHEVLSCTKYDGFVRSLEYFKKQVFSSDLSGYKVIRRGDFGFPSNHVEEGSIGLQNIVDIGLVSPIYTVFRFDPEQVDNDYAYAVLKTSLYRHIFEVSTSASVDRRGSLRWKEFSKIPFPVPPIEEQRAIVAALKTARADLYTTKREITALQRQKRGLMQKLLTGEWRVKVHKETEAAK